MLTKSAELQNQINDIDRKIQEGVNLSSRNQLEADRNNLNEQLQAALFEESQQNLQERVEQAKETGYLLDTLDSNGIKLIELSHTPENHELVAIAVQRAVLAMEDVFNRKYATLQEFAEQQATINSEKEEINQGLLAENRQLKIEKTDAESKRDNAMNQLEEQQEMNSKQRATIESLKSQLAGESVPLAPLSAEERETKLLAELNGNRTKVTNIRLKDTNGFDTRISMANNALTGEEIEFHTIYIKRYEEISEEAAQQLRDEYTSKKAEIELSIPVLETPAIPFVNEDTRQDEAAADKAPNETDQVDAAGHELAESPSSNQGQVGEAESEVITLESLQAQVDKIKSHLGLVA